MRGGRTIVWLVAGIVILIAVHLAVDMRTASAPRSLRRNVLVPSADKAKAFAIARPDGTAARLARDGGGGWRIAAPYEAQAEMRTVLRLADALAFSPIQDEMSDAELLRLGRTRGDFGLEQPRVVVSVGTPERDATAVSFGSATPTGDGVYAVVGDSASVYVVSSNVWNAVNLDVADFRCRSVFGTTAEDVTAFDVKGMNGSFCRLVRSGETWRLVEPHERVMSSSRVRKFLKGLVELEAREFVWPAAASNGTDKASVSLLAGYGLDPESSITVTLKCPYGLEQSASFGRVSGRGSVYALVQDRSAIVTVPSEVRDAAAAGLDAFLDMRLFPLDEIAVNALSLDDGRGVLLLARGADGAWRLDAPVSAAADPQAAAALVRRLLALKDTDVAREGVRVSIGTNATPVVVSRENLLGGMRIEDLRAKEILSVDPKVVKRLVVTDARQKPVAVAFDAERRVWNVESSATAVAADGEAVTKLAAALHPLRALRVVRLKVSVSELSVFGLDKPVRTVAVDQTLEDSVRRNLFIGDVTDGGRYATLGSSDAVFVISSESADVLLAPIVK